MSDASDRAQRLVGRFLQPSQRIGCNPAPALSFLSWPFFVWPGCKPANRVRTKVRTFRVAAIPHRPALTGISVRLPTPPGANRKPCKPCFLFGRWRNAALAPPVLECRKEGPLSPGAYVRPPTITIGDDHHHRHNHHGRWPAVTVVMVVTVAPYCLHRRKRRYALVIRPSHDVRLLHPRRDIPLSVQHAPDIDMVRTLDVEHQVRVARQRPCA